MKSLTYFYLGIALVLSTTQAKADPLKFDANVPSNIQTQMLSDLSFIGGVTSTNASPFHMKVFGKVDGANYLSWFNQRIFSVGLNDCGNPHAVACVITGGPQEADNKMWLTPNYSVGNHPQIARISILYHEARHTEKQNKNWAHATCPTPFQDAQGKDMTSIWTGALLAGQPACDVTAFGSYGSQTIFLKNIAKYCTSCNDKTKADAEMFGDDQLGRIIDPSSKKKMIADFAL